jgi:lysophospholipase
LHFARYHHDHPVPVEHACIKGNKMDDLKFSSGVGYVRTPDQITLRYGFWPCGKAPVGTVVLLNGRSEFLEKYKEPIHRLNQRGFDVFSLDWRGQGLSSRLLANPQKGFVSRFEDYLADLKTCLTRLVFPRARQPVVFLAHSMGGHIALRYLLALSGNDPSSDSVIGGIGSDHHRADHNRRHGIRGALLSSPMIDIHTHPFPKGFVKRLSRIMVQSGFSHAYAVGSRDYDPGRQVFSGNPLTSDPVRFEDHVRAVKDNPRLALGGVTYGWLSAAYDSMTVLNDLALWNAVNSPPVWIAGAGNDQIVSIAAQEALCRCSAGYAFILIKAARHEILKEKDAVQARFWAVFDDFIRRVIRA